MITPTIRCTPRGAACLRRWSAPRPDAYRQSRHQATATAHCTTTPCTPAHDVPEISPLLEPSPHFTSRLDSLKSAKPLSSFLVDTFNREHDYLRISITEKCNLRCLYCMPEEGVPLSPKKHLLTPTEIFYLSSLFVSQGVTKIRLTGGEPTVHPQILPLLRDIGSLRKQGLCELALTTNGLTLARKLDAMAEAGVTGINLSLDTLDPFQFELMTRRRGFDQVMKSINKILEMNRAGGKIKLKINAVVIRGLNDAQIKPFVEMTRNQDLEIRFIEYMPFDGNRWSSQKMLGYQEMLAIIREKYPDLHKIQDHPNDTSKTFQVPGFAGRIGFITSMTDHFCGTCNRLRITSDGNLKVCLFGNAEVSLRDMLRNNFNQGEPIDAEAWEAMKQIEVDRHEGRIAGELGLQQKEQELLNLIGMAVRRKKEKHAGIGNLEHMKNRPMILIDTSTPSNPCYQSKPTSSTPAPRFNLGRMPPWTTIPAFTLPSLPNHCTIRTFSHSTLPHTSNLTSSTNQTRLTHLTQAGAAHMVSIPPPTSTSTTTQTKQPTMRISLARAILSFSNAQPMHLIRNSLLQKGDVLSVARIAGIMAAKRTSDLIPLCHNIPLGGVNVEVDVVDGGTSSSGRPQKERPQASAFMAEGDSSVEKTMTAGHRKGFVHYLRYVFRYDTASRVQAASNDEFNTTSRGRVDTQSPGREDATSSVDVQPAEDEDVGPHGGIVITARVHCFGQTGVEMEALTAASVAGLTVYDMCKAVDRGMKMHDVRVLLKEGGKSGRWIEGKNDENGGHSSGTFGPRVVREVPGL